jgi:Leucine Rich Repeat (LRR) protein
MKPTSPTTSFIRWRQFSLRTLLIVVTLASLPLAAYVWLRSAAQRQARAVAELRQMGATVQYSFEPAPAAAPGAKAPAAKTPPPETAFQRWARRNLGSDFAHHVDSIAMGRPGRTGDPQQWRDFFQHARELRGVKVLQMHGATIGDDDLARLPFLETLERLVVDRTLATDAAMLPLSRATQLRTLELTDTPVGDRALEAIDAPRLQELVLRRTMISNRGLAPLADMPELSRLSLSSVRVTGSGVVAIGPKPKLTHLELVDMPLDDQAVRGLSSLTNLEELLLVATRITGSDLDQLAPLTKLKRLSLAGSPIDDAGLAKLPPLPGCVHLDLSFTDITDEGIRRARLPPNLQQIVLNGTLVRDQTLLRLEGLPKLAAVEVKYTDVTPMGVQQFQSARPKCAVFN